MQTQERTPKLATYGNAYSELVTALQRFPAAMWHFKPAPDQWSVHETIIHITDSEANSYVRCRRFLAEPGSTVMAYDENQWARALHYSEQSTDAALELFKWLRQNTYQLIHELPEATWANTVAHPENGTMTLDDWLDIYARHVTEHVAQMDAVYTVWQRQQG